jgi:uncharacterized cupin superfamily protein
MDSSMSTAHWDDVEAVDAAGVRSRDLGRAAGAVRLGLERVDAAPGARAWLGGADGIEETTYVLSGSGDGERPLRAGDVLLRAPGAAATEVVAGADGLTALTFRAGAAAGATPAGGPAGAAGAARNVDELPALDLDHGVARARAWWIGRALGATTVMVNRAEIAAGHEAAPLHCHSRLEELFVVVDGDGALVLGGAGRDEEEHPVRAGSIVSRPAATGIAHAFRAGAEGMSVLMCSDVDPDDMCFYPRSGKVAIRALGIVFRPELTTYWD